MDNHESLEAARMVVLPSVRRLDATGQWAKPGTSQMHTTESTEDSEISGIGYI